MTFCFISNTELFEYFDVAMLFTAVIYIFELLVFAVLYKFRMHCIGCDDDFDFDKYSHELSLTARRLLSIRKKCMLCYLVVQ